MTTVHDFHPEFYSFEPGEEHQKEVIWIGFPYDRQLINHLKTHTKAKWSHHHKKWYVPDNTHYRNLLGLEAKYFSTKQFIKIHSINQQALERYVDLLHLKGYSANTIRTYTNEFIQLLITLKSYPVEKLESPELRSYLLFCVKKLKLSESVIHSRMNALKFFFEQVLHRDKYFFDIPRPKKRSTLPQALSTLDIRKMLLTLKNTKHQLLLKLCYGMGLRVSELVNLRITDIDSDRMQVLIRQGKGKKDRYVILPDSVLEDLRAYYREYKPKDFLFEGQNGGQYSIRSVQQVFKTAMKKARINKKVGVHSLRHSYATHLIEQGTDIRFVQELLGHKDIKTTMIYTHLTDSAKRKIKSPLDNI